MQKFILIQDELRNVLNDFTGFSVNFYSISFKAFEFLLVGLLFFQMYCIGRILERLFFKNIIDKKLSFFVKFSLGYVFVGSSIFLLGLFSILTRTNIVLLLCALTLISLFDTVRFGVKINLPQLPRTADPVKILLIGFVVIYSLRVLPPAVNGDGNDYHISFPRVYLMEKTMMVPPLGDESYSTVPHLPEMLYIPAEVFTHGEMSRIIHLAFFFLVFYLLYVYGFASGKEKKINQFAALLFVSAPLILHIAPSPFSDFPAILCLMLVGYILSGEKPSSRVLVLAGILMGGALASKVWVFVIFPVYLVYLLFLVRRRGIGPVIKSLAIFVVAAVSIFALWLVRSYILSGNIFYINENLGRNDAKLSLAKYLLQGFGPNYLQYRFGPTGDFGFIYLLGLIVTIMNFKKLRQVINKNYLILVILLMLSALILPFSYASGRYSLPYIIPVFTIASFGLVLLHKKEVYKFIMLGIFGSIAVYYGFNTLLQLPYAFGWADTRNYEKRYVVRDPVAYYDFNGEFSKKIEKDEVIMTYGIRVFSFAHFRHKNLYYFVDQEKGVLTLTENDASKVLIRGGDFRWMCEKENLKNCDNYTVTLLTFDAGSNQRLYSIKYKNAE